MKYNPYIVIVPVDAMTDGRIVLDRLSRDKFQDEQAVLNAICYDENDPCAEEEVLIMKVHEFCDYCNDEGFNAVNNWIGTVEIEVKSETLFEA